MRKMGVTAIVAVGQWLDTLCYRWRMRRKSVWYYCSIHTGASPLQASHSINGKGTWGTHWRRFWLRLLRAVGGST